MCLCERGPHSTSAQYLDFPFWLGLGVFRQKFPVSRRLSDAVLGVLTLFVERNTSITTSHKSRASNPSIRDPASNGMICDPVELWDADVCF